MIGRYHPHPETLAAWTIGIAIGILWIRALCDRHGHRIADRVDRWRDRIRNT